MWRWTDGRQRCKSNSCRPGDPFGCSETKARNQYDRTEHLLSGWLRAGHYAYVISFAVTGTRGSGLETLIDEAQAGMKRALGSSSWVAEKKAAGVVGQISSLAVAQNNAGAWVVRRRLALAVVDPLNKVALEKLRANLIQRWERASYTELQATKFRGVAPSTSSAAAQFISGYSGEFDPVIPSGSNPWEAAATDERRPSDLDLASDSFSEFAHATKGRQLWSAQVQKSSDSDEVQLWNRFLEQSVALEERYIPIEISTSRRRSPGSKR